MDDDHPLNHAEKALLRAEKQEALPKLADAVLGIGWILLSNARNGR